MCERLDDMHLVRTIKQSEEIAGIVGGGGETRWVWHIAGEKCRDCPKCVVMCGGRVLEPSRHPGKGRKAGVPVGVDLSGTIEERDHREFIEDDEYDRRSGIDVDLHLGEIRLKNQPRHRWRQEEKAGNDQRYGDEPGEGISQPVRSVVEHSNYGANNRRGYKTGLVDQRRERPRSGPGE